jgi:hypothetical protein
MFIVSCVPTSAAVKAQSPEALLFAIHDQASTLPPGDRVDLLYQLSISATGVNAGLSARWAIEMYDLATTRMSDNSMMRAAQRKNALTVLSFSDAEGAAELFFQLEPSQGHRLSEDPRVDLSRHLFPRLWAKNGSSSLPLIRRLAKFTASTVEYPYAAMASLIPQVARVDSRSARELFVEGVRQMPGEHRIHRSQDMYVRFLRSGWPLVSRSEGLQAVRAGLLGAERLAHDFELAPGGHSYFEYYLDGVTVRLDSELDARIYEFLPFADEVDSKLGESLRQRYPRLKGLAVPGVSIAPWRAGAFALAGRDTPQLVERALERHNVLFIGKWAQEDAGRAARIALSANDVDLRRTQLALVLPWYVKVDSRQVERWRGELEEAAHSGEASADFLVALTGSELRLGHSDEARELADLAWKLYRGEGDSGAMQQLADLCGQYWFGDAAWSAEFNRVANQPARLMLLARYVRGAMRNRAGYQEPA